MKVQIRNEIYEFGNKSSNSSNTRLTSSNESCCYRPLLQPGFYIRPGDFFPPNILVLAAPYAPSDPEPKEPELGPVVAMTNSGNLDFAMNWLNSLRRVGVRDWLIFATDDRTARQLQRKVESADVEKIRRMPESLYSGKDDKKHHQYRSAGWTKMMHSVPRLLRWLLFEELKGPVLYSDTDIVWLEQPYSAFPENTRA